MQMRKPLTRERREAISLIVLEEAYGFQPDFARDLYRGAVLGRGEPDKLALETASAICDRIEKL